MANQSPPKKAKNIAPVARPLSELAESGLGWVIAILLGDANLGSSVFDCGAEQLLQCLNVFGEGRSAGVRHAIERLRFALDKLLLDCHVAGLFKLEQLRAEVAVG